MNDIIFDPPTPTPSPKPATNMKQMGAIIFLIGAVALLIGILIAPSSNDSNKAAAPTTAAPVITAAPAPVYNKYDQYLEHVYNNSGQANSMTKAKLIEDGDIICSALDQGKTVAWIVNYLANGSTNQSDMELYAAIVYGAIHYICSEYTGDLNLYLNNN